MADPVILGLVGLAVALAGPALRALQILVRMRMEARLERARRMALAEVLRAMPAGGALCEQRPGSLLVVVSLPERPHDRHGAPAPSRPLCSRRPSRSHRSPRCGLRPGPCRGPRPGA
jgi:hypothetical protein